MANTNLAQLLEKILARVGFPTEAEGGWAKKLVDVVDTEMKTIFEKHSIEPQPTPKLTSELPPPGEGASVAEGALPTDDTSGAGAVPPAEPVPTAFAGAPTQVPAPDTP